ncbi:MAG: DUF2283 domain-containing protein [Desulfobacterales bacterium]|nr:DUF2283 domain-containing protein [Desulfobacterales bacterium]
MEINYFKEEDIMHIVISEGPERGSAEINPNITLDLNENREIIGIEILEASKFIRDYILESAQAKLMNMDYEIKNPVKARQPGS